MMTRAQMAAEITAGRSVMWDDRIITDATRLPSDAEIGGVTAAQTGASAQALRDIGAAVDAEVVHLDGTETISGAKTFGVVVAPVRRKTTGTPSVSGSTITLDAAAADDWAAVTLGAAGPYTIAVTNAAAGKAQTLTVLLVQDGTGGRTVVTWPGGTTSPGGSSGRALSTAAGAKDRAILYYDGTSWYVHVIQAYS